NLRHIWGDGRCNRDDYVADTPKSDRPNFGCPADPTVHCRSNDMTMNYMDYVYDNCMYMFSDGQNDRMRALFATGGVRESFVP
ncbi:MAG: zinc metalloprotease, partial [Maribacter sp.]|nr:zinc metalloprotease [Maribacter sp.]